MKATETDLVVIDFETTGSVPSYPNEPWQVGMVRMRGGVVDADKCFDSLLRVGDRPFNPHAPGNHHLYREKIARAPSIEDLWPELEAWWVGTPLVAHNAGTEKKVMVQAAPLHSFGPWIDTLKLVRGAYPDLASHALEDVLTVLNLESRVVALCPGRESHDALYDAVGCAVLLEHLLGLDGWGTLEVEDLVRVRPAEFYRRLRG